MGAPAFLKSGHHTRDHPLYLERQSQHVDLARTAIQFLKQANLRQHNRASQPVLNWQNLFTVVFIKINHKGQSFFYSLQGGKMACCGALQIMLLPDNLFNQNL